MLTRLGDDASVIDDTKEINRRLCQTWHDTANQAHPAKARLTTCFNSGHSSVAQALAREHCTQLHAPSFGEGLLLRRQQLSVNKDVQLVWRLARSGLMELTSMCNISCIPMDVDAMCAKLERKKPQCKAFGEKHVCVCVC